ncbi:MAG: hypothetical protein SFU91_04735 [Chloroherpetonaceae bacterium]|nr:hypothetical protein [Chloroherpetonaceae bacterium]
MITFNTSTHQFYGLISISRSSHRALMMCVVLSIAMSFCIPIIAQESAQSPLHHTVKLEKGEMVMAKVSTNSFVRAEAVSDSALTFVYQLPPQHQGEAWGEARFHFEPSLALKSFADARETAVGIDIFNPMHREVFIFLGLDSKPFDQSTRLSGWVRLPPQKQSRIHLYFPSAYANDSPKRLKGYPPLGGALPVWNVLSPQGFEESSISLLLLSVKNPSFDTLQVQRVFFFNSDSLFRGIIDAYGQFAYGNWEGKLPSNSNRSQAAQFLTRERQKESKALSKATQPEQNAIGAWRKSLTFSNVIGKAGFFRVGMANEKWWFMAPSRSNTTNPFFSLGMGLLTTHSGSYEVEYQLPSPDKSETASSRKAASFARFHQTIPEKSEGLTKEIPDLGYFPGVGSSMVNYYWQNCLLKYSPQNPRDLYRILPDIAYRRLRSWGFNTVGNWSNDFTPQSAARSLRERKGEQYVLPSRKLPYVITLYSYIGAPSIRPDYFMPDVFHPAFAEHALRVFQNEIARANGKNLTGNDLRNDPMILGYFIDNELPWDITPDGSNSFYLIKQIFSSTSVSRQVLIDSLKARYNGSIEALTNSWRLSSRPASWENLSFPAELTAEATSDFSHLTLIFARAYFSTVRQALQRVDSNHLYLGCRFATFTPELIQASNELCDVVSFNVYADSLTSWKRIKVFRAAQTNKTLTKPIIIGEFHFGAEDRGLSGGLVNKHSTAARALAYEAFVASVSKEPQLVGCHWFQYADQALTGRTDGENYNIGFIDVLDSPYTQLVSSASKAHRSLYSIRFGRR